MLNIEIKLLIVKKYKKRIKMIVEFQNKKIDLDKVVRLYPAALVEVPNDTPAEV